MLQCMAHVQSAVWFAGAPSHLVGWACLLFMDLADLSFTAWVTRGRRLCGAKLYTLKAVDTAHDVAPQWCHMCISCATLFIVLPGVGLRPLQVAPVF